MRIPTKRPIIKTVAVAVILVGGLGAATLQAQEPPRQPGTMMNQPGMMGMMGMMRQMNQMMQTCNGMMQGMMQKQNQQKSPATTPEKKG